MEAKSKEEEGGKVVEMKMTPEQQRRAEQEHRKRQQAELSNYKKGLKAGNEMKTMQVEELELNIRYYNAKRKWLDLQPQMMELEAEEQAMILKEQKEQRDLIEKQKKEALDKLKVEKPDIVIPEQGKARDK